MSFGRNPHVAKAEAAELKANNAGDDTARTLAWREAARLWTRAAEREKNDKRRQDYEQRADTARATSEGETPEADDADGTDGGQSAPQTPKTGDRWLN